MENFKKFTQRIEEGLSVESAEIEIHNIIESSLGVLKNNLLDTEDKINGLKYRQELLETLRKKMSEEILDLKYKDIQTAIDLIETEIEKLKHKII